MSPKLKKVLRIGLIGGVAVFVLLQIMPRAVLPEKFTKGINDNPPERFDIAAPPEVATIMRRACFDCHTNETRWPLYSRIAPGSWLMARDVNTGRSHLNFSEWEDSDDEERQLDLENCWDQIESGEMPPWFYIFPLHPNAKLSDADKATLKAWFLKNKGKVADKDDEDKGDDDKDGDAQADKSAGESAEPDKAGAEAVEGEGADDKKAAAEVEDPKPANAKPAKAAAAAGKVRHASKHK